MNCGYEKWNDGKQPCCTHDCDWCLWSEEAEDDWLTEEDFEEWVEKMKHLKAESN